MARRVIQACGGEIRGKRIAVLGLTFKPNTDDMRDAPSLALIAGLRDFGAKISAYDPEGTRTREMLDGVDYAEDPYACAKGADALVIVTEWDAFRALDFERIKKQMAALVLVDLRNIFDPTEISRHGFTYVTVGRPRAARLPGKCKVACREEASGT